jgi:hypothetical protein
MLYLIPLAIFFNIIVIFNYIKHKYYIDIIINLVSITISYLIINWIDKIEKNKCKCSENYKRDYIKYGWYFVIIITIISLIINIINHIFKNIIIDYDLLKLIYSLIFTYIIILTILYIYDLKTKKCICSESYSREIAFYYSIMELILYLFSISGMIITLYLYSIKNKL